MIEERHRNNSKEAVNSSVVASTTELSSTPLYAYPKKMGFFELESRSRTIEHIVENAWMLFSYAFGIFSIIWLLCVGFMLGQYPLQTPHLESVLFISGGVTVGVYFILRVVKNVFPIYYIMGEPVSDQLREGIKHRVFTDSELRHISNATYQHGVLSKSGNLSSLAHGFDAGEHLSKMEGEALSRISNLVDCQDDNDMLVQANLDARVQIIHASQPNTFNDRSFKVQERIARSSID